jgi:nicotinate dehydrogenase subunit A
MKLVSFKLDGDDIEIETNPDASLLSILREDLSRLGVRTGCLLGRCGSCMVLVDGRPMQACSTPIWSIEGCAVSTVEGARPGSWMARVREVFLEEQAAQCGYCVNGIMTTVAGYLDRAEPPSRQHLLELLDERHLCRCGAHVRMLRALDRLELEACQGKLA